MAENVCPQCGAPVSPGSLECKFCGEKLVVQNTVYQQPQMQQPQMQQPQIIIQNVGQPVNAPGVNPAWPIKSKVVAGILALFLGGLGIHKFYLGKPGMGILYIVFSWSLIPAIVGFIEGIIYLCSSDLDFQLKNNVRLQ